MEKNQKMKSGIAAFVAVLVAGNIGTLKLVWEESAVIAVVMLLMLTFVVFAGYYLAGEFDE